MKKILVGCDVSTNRAVGGDVRAQLGGQILVEFQNNAANLLLIISVASSVVRLSGFASKLVK